MSEDAMKAAITAAKGNDKPITLVTSAVRRWRPWC
jgi:hypothetical protein